MRLEAWESSMQKLPLVSVVMPVRNEERFIRHSVAAVLSQDYPAYRMEVLIADGMSTDSTRDILERLAARDSRLRIIDNPGRIVATGLNASIATARGDIIIRVDGHCEVAPDYVRRCVTHVLDDDVDGVGGYVETIGETYTARVIARAMSSTFGVGGVAFRTGGGRSLLADTIPFPAYRRDAIERAGQYDEEFIRNQDDEYNYRLRKLGAKLLLAADVRSRYFSRSTLRSLWRQYYGYGFWKVRVLQKHPHQMSARQFVPAAFLISLAGSAALALALPAARSAFLSVAAAYAIVNIAATVWTCRRDPAAIPLMPVAFAALHFGYGLGFLKGLAQFRRRFREMWA
jgi:glycosyltransferase involved in cell wall biosynthesis